MNTISFTANYVTDTLIKSHMRNCETINKKVSIVELDKYSQSDRDTVYKTACYWDVQGKQNYAWNVLSAMERVKYPEVETEHYYALTTQKKDFDILNPKLILGILQFSELYRDENTIDWFQVKPRHNYVVSNDKRGYSHVGEALLSYLQENYKNKPILVASSKDAINFYKKYGFKSNDAYDYEMTYNA